MFKKIVMESVKCHYRQVSSLFIYRFSPQDLDFSSPISGFNRLSFHSILVFYPTP